MFKRILSSILIACFLMTSVKVPDVQADMALNLPQPGVMIDLSPAYAPVIIKGLTVHKNNPFLFDFILDQGQENLSAQALKIEGERLIKYFLASLAIPDRDMWVTY